MRKQTVNKNACLVLNLHILYQTGLPHACGKLASRKHTKKNMFPHSACGSQTKNVCQAGGLEFLGYPFLGILNSKFDQLSASSGSFMPTIVRCPPGKQDIIHTLSKDASQWKHIWLYTHCIRVSFIYVYIPYIPSIYEYIQYVFALAPNPLWPHAWRRSWFGTSRTPFASDLRQPSRTMPSEKRWASHIEHGPSNWWPYKGERLQACGDKYSMNFDDTPKQGTPKPLAWHKN